MKFEDLTNGQLKGIIRQYNHHLKIVYSKLKRDDLLILAKKHFEIDDEKIKLKKIEPIYFDIPEKKVYKRKQIENHMKETSSIKNIEPKKRKTIKKREQKNTDKNIENIIRSVMTSNDFVDYDLQDVDDRYNDAKKFKIENTRNPYKYDEPFLEYLNPQINESYDNAQFYQKHKILDKLGDELNKVLNVNELKKVIDKIPPHIFDKISNFVSEKGEKLEYISFVKKYLYGIALKDFFKKMNINAFYAVAICNMMANDPYIQHNFNNATKYAIITSFLLYSPFIPYRDYPSSIKPLLIEFVK